MFSDVITPDLAEICGIHAGDGYLRNGRHVELDLSGNISEDRNYYDTHVAPLFSKVFGVEPKLRQFPSRGTYGFVIREKEVVKFFHNFLGFPSGAKARVVRVPQIITQSYDSEIYGRFLRGLYDTDGCLNFQRRYGNNVPFKKTHNVYPRIIFSTVSEGLRLDLAKLFDFIGMQCRVQTYLPLKRNWSPVFKFWIYGEKYLERWVKEIGFKNIVQMTRYRIWKKYGHCPPNMSLDERIQILKGTYDD